jgi:hypothetical protein
LEIEEAFLELADGDVRLEPREERSQAIVGTGREREVRIRSPSHVEPIGIGELRRIPVHGTDGRSTLAAALPPETG